MSFTTEEFKNVVKSLMHWGLVFKVRLATSGPVFRSLGEQVVAHLESLGIILPGYDATKPWETPQDLPFVLLAGQQKDMFTKVHTPYDSFNGVQFTYKALTGARPPLTRIACPVGDELMPLKLLRISMSFIPWLRDAQVTEAHLLAPRFGDLQGPLDNHTAYLAGAPGIDDFLTIPHRERPHPCFPRRLLASILRDRLTAACLRTCPRATPPPSPSSTSPPGSPVATSAPIPVPAPRLSLTALLEAEGSPSPPENPFEEWLPNRRAPADVPPLFLPEPMDHQDVAPSSGPSDTRVDPVDTGANEDSATASSSASRVSVHPGSTLTQPYSWHMLAGPSSSSDDG